MGKKILIGNKEPEYYKGLIIRADPGLHNQVSDELLKLLPKGSKILDLGAGEGALALRLQDLGYEVLAVDVNEKEFKCASVKFKKVNFNSVTEINFLIDEYSENFDAVLGLEVIEHVENPYEYIRLLKKLLRTGGYMILTTPNITSWISRMQFLFKAKFHQFQDEDLEYGHISPISEWELKVILKNEKFQEINIFSGGTLPVIWLKRDKRILIYNFLSLIFRPFMKGIKDGWCLICIARK